MIGKGTKLYSILFGVCPKCHQESMYIEKNPYRISKTLKMHEKCSYCHTKYQIEPSFFFGSMYVSYGLSIAFGVTTFIISYVILESTIFMALVAIISTLILLMPVLGRLSRNICINLFMSYNKTLANKSD